MNVKLSVDEEMLDVLIVASLTQSIDYTESELKKLEKRKKKLKPHEEEDLRYHRVYLDSLKRTRYYYGGQKYFYDHDYSIR